MLFTLTGIQLLFLLLLVPHSYCDPCDDRQSILISDNRRSSQNVPGPQDELICDYSFIQSGMNSQKYSLIYLI